MKKYTLQDTNPMSWQEFGTILDDLVTQISEYLAQNSLQIHAVAPILRSGAIPGSVIANKLEIIPQLPIQVKHNYQQNKLEQILPVTKLLTPLPKKPTILVAECNTYSGKSARKAGQLVLENYSQATLMYATVTKVYRKDEIDLSLFDKVFVGKHTNESFEADHTTAKELDLRPKITIFPWETPERELRDINGE